MFPLLIVTITCSVCLAALVPLAILAYYGRLSVLVIPAAALFGTLAFAAIGAGFGWLADFLLGSGTTGIVIGAIIGGLAGLGLGLFAALRS